MNRFLSLAIFLASVFGASPSSGFSLDTVSSSSRTIPLVPKSATLSHHRGSLAFAKSPKSLSRLFFTPAEDNDDKKDQVFIRPALHNSPFFRALAILYALLFAVYQTSGAPAANTLQKLGKHLIVSPKAAATLHLLAFATWFGTVVYTTFIAGITMFKNLPRRTFGTLQSKLFPLYFQLCTAMIGIQVSFLYNFSNVLTGKFY